MVPAMSEFASYCLYVRDQKNSKQAGWQEDILKAIQDHPIAAGGVAGGLLGGITGIGSGNMLRNGLIGAGLGGGAGYLYDANYGQGSRYNPVDDPSAGDYNPRGPVDPSQLGVPPTGDPVDMLTGPKQMIA